eukprot:EG_transcript_5177
MIQVPQILALVILLCLLFSFMVNKDGSPRDSEGSRTQGDPRVQFLLASPRLSPIDIFVNDRLLATSLVFGQATGYLPVRHSDVYRLQTQSHGMMSFVKLLTLNRYRAYTVIIVDLTDTFVLDDSSWQLAARHRHAPVLRFVDLTQRTHPLEVELRNLSEVSWFHFRWKPQHTTDWLEVRREGSQQIELHYNRSVLLNVTVFLQRRSGYNFFLLRDREGEESQLLGLVRPAFVAAPLKSVSEYTFCISILLLVWCNLLHRLYMSYWSYVFRRSFKPLHSRNLPSIREVNMFVYSVTMTVGLCFFIGASYSFLYPVGLEGVWDGLVRLELTTRMDYYQNYFKALGVMIVVLYSYEVMTDLRMPVSTIIHHGGAITGTVFLISFTDEIAEFWFGWISLAYVQFELFLFWGLYLRDYNARTGRWQRASEGMLIAGWLFYMVGMLLELVFYGKALVSLRNRVSSAFLWMTIIVMTVWLIEQLMCLCCTSRSIKRKNLLQQYPALEGLCWFSWWLSRYPASLAKFNLQLLQESWEQIPKVHDVTTKCSVTVHSLPFTVWIPSAFEKDPHAKLHKIRLQAAEELEKVANTLLPQDLALIQTSKDVEDYGVNSQGVTYGT